MSDPQSTAPPDRFKVVYLIFLTHGIGVLIPWNMFITAFDYFTFKLSQDYIGYLFSYLSNFMQCLTFSSQVPNIIFSWLNAFIQFEGSITAKIVWTIFIEVVIFIVTVLLAMVDSSTWPDGFFWTTMVCVVILNMLNAIYQNTVFALASKLPGKYIGAIILGNNICGTFTAVVSIISKASASSDKKVAAIYYFITAIFVLMVCFDTYFLLPLNKYYRYFDTIEKKLQQEKGSHERPPYVHILKKSFIQLYNVFFVFFVSLSIFPAIKANIQPSDKDFFIPVKYYTDVTCFITFNFFAMIGSLLPTFFIWPSAKFLWIPVTLRVLYIPFYLLCNYQVEAVTRSMPVIFGNDWAYWVVSVTMSLTHGYFSSLAMMYAPGTVEEKHAAVAGMFAGASLVSGVFFGVVITFLWPWLISI